MWTSIERNARARDDRPAAPYGMIIRLNHFPRFRLRRGRFWQSSSSKWNQMGLNRSFPGMTSYRNSMKAAPIMAVGRMAQRNNFAAEIPSSPNRETRID